MRELEPLIEWVAAELVPACSLVLVEFLREVGVKGSCWQQVAWVRVVWHCFT